MLQGTGQGGLCVQGGGIKAIHSDNLAGETEVRPQMHDTFSNDRSNYSVKPAGFSTSYFKVTMSSGRSSGSSHLVLGTGMTHHLSLVLAFLPDVTQHVSELGLLLVHFVQAVLGILFLSFQLL